MINDPKNYLRCNLPENQLLSFDGKKWKAEKGGQNNPKPFPFHTYQSPEDPKYHIVSHIL